VLKNYEDYSLIVKSYYKTASTGAYLDLESFNNSWLRYKKNFLSAYTITIKPEVFFKNIGWINSLNDPIETTLENSSVYFEVNFAISNADVDIFLDAKRILKENAYPKVSYTAGVNIWDKE